MGASYRAAIKWVAENDGAEMEAVKAGADMGPLTLDDIEKLSCVRMASALFDTSAREIAADVRAILAGKKEKCGLTKGCALRKGHKPGCVNEFGEKLAEAAP